MTPAKGLLGSMLAAAKSGGGRKDPEPPESSREVDDEAEAMSFDAAFDDFIDAMKADDTEGARDAFKAAIHACMNDEEY